MKLLKSAFGFLWALWGAFWFMLVVAIFTILYAILFFFTGKKYVRACIWINCHILCNFLLASFLIRVREHGKNKVDPKGTYVFVANHLTQLDTIIAGSCAPHPVSFLAKAEVRKIPFFGYMVKMLAIMVDRKSRESREKSVRFLVEELSKGHSIFLFPEGTRNRTPEPLKEFKEGAFRMAVMAQVPIAVQTIVGAKKLNDPARLQLYPGVVDVYWSDPIETKGMTLEDVPKLVQRVRSEMEKYLRAY